MPGERIIGVSHWKDLDGVASAAIIYRRFSNCTLYWSEPQNLNITLRKLAKQKNISKLYISDLGINPKIVGEVAEILYKLRGRTQIFWYDHHHWKPQHRHLIGSIVEKLVVDTSKCAAAITFEELNSEDEVSKKLAAIACDSDFWTKKIPLTRKLDKVVASNIDRDVIVRKLASGIFWDEEFEEIYRKRVKVEEDIIREATSKVKEYTMPNGLRIAIVTGDYPSSLIGGELASRGYDVIAIVSSNGGVSLRRGNKRINLLPIAEKLGGGGHPFAAGGSLDYNFLDRLLAKLGYYRKMNYLLKSIIEGLRDVTDDV